MAKFEIDVGEGRTIVLEAPPDVNQDELYLQALQWAEANPKPEPKGFFSSLATGAKENVTGPLNLAEVIANPEDVAAQQKMLEDYRKEHAGSTSFSNVQEAFKKGVGAGLGETGLYARQLLGGSIGAGIGGIAGGLGGAATPVPGGALAGSTAGFTLSHVQEALMAQIEEREKARAAGQPVPPFDFTALGGATAVMGALDRFGFGVAGLGKLFGAKGSEVGSSIAREAKRERAAKLAGEGMLASGIKGTAKTAAVEAPIGVAQEALVRQQAGQDLTSPEAMDAYKEALAGGAFLGPLGIAGRRMQVNQAGQEVQDIDARNQQDAAALEELGNKTQAGQDEFEAENQSITEGADASMYSGREALAEEGKIKAEEELQAKKTQYGLENLDDEKSRLVISAYERLKNEVPGVTPSQVVNQAIGDVRASIEVLENQYDNLVQNNDFDGAKEVRNQIIAETAQLKEWGGVTASEKAAVEKELSKTQSALKKAMDEMKTAATPEEFEVARAKIPELQKTITGLENQLKNNQPVSVQPQAETVISQNPFEQQLDETEAEIKDPTQPMDELRLNEQQLQNLGIRNATDRGLLQERDIYDPTDRAEVIGVIEEYVAKQKNGPTEQQQAALDFLRSLDHAMLMEGFGVTDTSTNTTESLKQKAYPNLTTAPFNEEGELSPRPAFTLQPSPRPTETAQEQVPQEPNPITYQTLADWGIPSPAIANPKVGGALMGLDLNNPEEKALAAQRLAQFYNRFKNPKLRDAIRQLDMVPDEALWQRELDLQGGRNTKPRTPTPVPDVFRSGRTQIETAPTPTTPQETQNTTQEQSTGPVPMGERPQTGEEVRGRNQQETKGHTAGESAKEEKKVEPKTPAAPKQKKEKATKKEEPIQGTKEEKELAKDMADSFGGEVAWQRGNLALVRAYGRLTGDVIYLAAKGDTYSNLSVLSDRFKLSALTSEETALIKEKAAELEAEAEKQHETNPYVAYDSDGLSFSESINPAIKGVVKGWAKLLGLNTKIHIAAMQDVQKNKGKYTGPLRSIGSGTLNEDEAGSMRRLSDGSYYVIFTGSTSKTRMLETLAHEMGHVHEKEVYVNTSPETKQKIREQYESWLKEQKGSRIRDLVGALRAKTSAKNTLIENADNVNYKPYWTSFAEWYADQVSRWAVTSDKPTNIVEQFFSRLGKALRSFYNKAQNQKYLPNETFKQYLETVHDLAKADPTAFNSEAQSMKTGEGFSEPLSPRTPRRPPQKPKVEAKPETKTEQKPADEGVEKKEEKPAAKNFDGHVENRLKEKQEKDAKVPVKQKLQNIASEAKKPSGWVKKSLDSIMRAIDATWDYKEMRKGRDTVEELVNLGLLAQIGHFGGLSRLIVETGGMKYDAKDGMVKAVNSKFNGKALNDKIIELAKTHGLDYARARIIVGDGLEGARVLDMMAQQEKAEARIAELEAKTRNKGEEKELNDLKEKWDDVVFHITKEEAEMRAQAFKKYPKEMKELKDIKNGMREWLVKALVDSGEWTETKAERMLNNADWIPFQREFSEDERASMEDYQSYASKLQHTMKQHKFKGSERQVTDVIDNFESWALYAARSAAQNMATRTLLKDAVKRFGDQVQKTNPPTPANKNRVAYYWEDGEKQYVEFQSPSMAALFNSGFISPQLDKVTQFFNTLFRMTIIALPTFSAVNLVRDSHQAMTKAGLPAHKAVKIMPLAIKEMVRLMRQGTTEAHEQLKPFGLVGAAADISTVSSKELSELTGYKALSSKEKGVIAKMQDYGLKMAMWSDNAVRQAVYTVAKDSGESDASARQIAANIINFRTPLGSRMLHTMAAWTPFMRAIISDQRASLNILSGRGQSNQAKKQVWKNYAMTTATLVAMKMILAAAMEDDEDYKKMSPEQRARQITIPFSGGWGIPTRVTLDTVPQALAEMMANQFTDNYVDATRNRGAMTAVAVEALLPYSEPLPAWPKVALEQMTNKNFFTGQPIVGHEMSKKSGFLQYSPDTSELGKLLGGTVKEVGDAFGFDALGKSGFASPKRIDHALRGLLGSVGAGALLGSNLVGAAVGVRPSMSTKDLLASIPGATQPGAKEFNSAARQDFYDLADRVTRAAEDLDAYVERGEVDKIPEFVEKNKGLLALDKSTQAIRDQLNKVRKTIEFISNDKNRTQEERTAEVRRLKETEARMFKQLNVTEMRTNAGL